MGHTPISGGLGLGLGLEVRQLQGARGSGGMPAWDPQHTKHPTYALNFQVQCPSCVRPLRDLVGLSRCHPSILDYRKQQQCGPWPIIMFMGQMQSKPPHKKNLAGAIPRGEPARLTGGGMGGRKGPGSSRWGWEAAAAAAAAAAWPVAGQGLVQGCRWAMGWGLAPLVSGGSGGRGSPEMTGWGWGWGWGGGITTHIWDLTPPTETGAMKSQNKIIWPGTRHFSRSDSSTNYRSALFLAAA
jgi:hypothetical protein